MARKVRNGLIKLFFGKTKSGKSYLAQKMLIKRKKAIIYDFAGWFTKGKVVEDFSISNFSRLLKRYGGKSNINKEYRLIFQKPSSMSHQKALQLVALFAVKLGDSYGKRALKEGEEIVFCVDEADKCVTKKDDDRVRLAVGAGRHSNLATWAITQRPMKIHPDFRDNASEIYLFKLGGYGKFIKEKFKQSYFEKLEDAPKYTHLFWNDEGEREAISKTGDVRKLS